ncbi:uncharacterized protein FIBRA_05140 [Fibroporia radiculosa]|uniref:Uncharacterized protein n=1 Tax=Fibroporia radiculosa TaxID=599839 RepID=J4G8M5_9APHY|nr:uncharacterized protein FIBRA_05140 [Fibroporia radiculosa]CCM03023.1 predicted protein [Fibroporia radiculosa]
MGAFLLDEPLDIGKWRKDAHDTKIAVDADPESDDDDRMHSIEMEDVAGKDLAAYHMVFFVADLLVSLALIHPNNVAEKTRRKRAMAKIVEYSTCPMHRLALGDNLTDSMRPLYWMEKVIVRFAHAGGLPALFDWAQSMATKFCDDAIQNLPMEMEGGSFAATPIFARIMHEIFTHYKLEPFERGSTLSHNNIIFFFLHRRLSRKPSTYKTPDAMLTLLKKFDHVPRTTRKRHGWMILAVSGRWDCLTLYGWGYFCCPELKALLELKDRRVRGVRDPLVEERLFQWG